MIRERRSTTRTLISWLLRCFGFLAMLILLYVCIAVLAAIFPVVGRAQSPETGQPVFVCADEVHSDILIPLSDTAIDWRGQIDLAAAQTRYPRSYAAFGWGDLVFFRDIPTWGDVRPGAVASALLGQHATAIRVLIVKAPSVFSNCVPISVDASGRQALVQHILYSLSGEPALGSESAQFEIYYPAKGRYGIFNTCNQWVADGLEKAGLPHARFAPFSFGVMWPLGSS